MKRNLFKLSVTLLSLFLLSFLSSRNANQKPAREFYQLSIYHYSNETQEKMLDQYFQTALLPAFHRMNIKSVGVFKAWSNDTSNNKLICVFFPIKNPGMLAKIPSSLKKDGAYISQAAAYLDAEYNHPPYSRIETILLRAFPLAPQMQLPVLKAPKKERVYELRSYESATERKFENKVKMFNDGNEIGLFKRLNFNAVFYAEVLSGSKMPNLMYMTSFENRSDREDHWKLFGNDPYWKKLSSLPEYQNNVSHIDITFLYPAEYSDY